MAEQITEMYNIVQTVEKDNSDPNKEKGRRCQIKKGNTFKRAIKSNESKRAIAIVKIVQAGGTPFWEWFFWAQREWGTSAAQLENQGQMKWNGDKDSIGKSLEKNDGNCQFYKKQ